MVNMEVMGMLTGTRRSRRPAIPRVMAGITAAVLMSVPAPGPSAAGPHAGAPKLAVAADPTATARVVKSFGRLLPGFEVNRGQVDAQVKFLTRGSGYTLFLTPSEAVLVLRAPDAMPAAGQALVSTAEVRMHLAGATAQPRVAGVEKLPGIVNYFLGNDPAQWHADIPTYAEVVYQGVYPGIDLIHHGTQGRLEYDFVVGPGAEPGAIRVEFQGADGIVVDAHGDLVLHTAVGDLRQRKPAIYQDVNGVRRAIAGDYVVLGPRRVGFQVAAYDRSRPLIIDPVLLYSTYLGGSGFEVCYDVAIDATGNAYVAGSTTLTDFPTTTGAVQTASGGSADAIVAKVDPTGSGLTYSTYLGGTAADVGYDIVTDAAGNAYVTGYTNSTNFPTTTTAFQTASSGSLDVFAAKVNPGGSGLVYSTYLGGGAAEEGYGIAVDGAGNAYVTGYTSSPDFPTTPGAFQAAFHNSANPDAAYDAFVTKLNPMGSGLIYSTYLGGGVVDVGYEIAIDADGNAYVTGYTASSNFPTTTGAFQTVQSGYADAFVTKVNPGGTGLLYSTFLGGGNNDLGYGIAVNAAGHILVAGRTASTNFPTTAGALQTGSDGPGDAFIAKFSSPATVPGQIEAEDFDQGGEGVAYHDLTPGNQGGQYRPAEDVDIIRYPNGAYVVNNFQTGEWLQYTIQVAQTGTYRLDLLVSRRWDLTSRWHAEIDNQPVTGSVVVPDTGSWDTFWWVGVGGITLTAGPHVLRIVADQEYFNFAALRILPAESPFAGTPAAVPGQIEAEDFDHGGEGVAYHDLTPGNQGGQYRPDVDVDISRYSNGAYVVNNFQTGEWLQYTIQVPQAGTYRLELLVSRRWDVPSRVHVDVDTQPVTGSVVVPDTGSWDVFWWVGLGSISLTAGTHVLRITADQEYFNVAAFRLLGP